MSRVAKFEAHRSAAPRTTGGLRQPHSLDVGPLTSASRFGRRARVLFLLLAGSVVLGTVPVHTFLPEDLTIAALKLRYQIDATGSVTHHWITVHSLTGVSGGSAGVLFDMFGITPDKVSDWTRKAVNEIGNGNAM